MSHVLGIDFGTLSARCVLVNIKTGEQTASSEHPYAHSVMDRLLPDGTTRLPEDWALQDPHDYLDCLLLIIRDCIHAGGVTPASIAAVGTDFTECTLLPTKADWTPLCFLPEFEHNPHAYVKLWKHHSPQPEANRLNKVARERNEVFLERYGGKVSCETLFPKVMEILNDAPEVYEAADRFIEASDWIPTLLTGREKRNSCTAGWKALWQKDLGFPSSDFFRALDPRLENVVEQKMKNAITQIGTRAGDLSSEGARLTGLRIGTPVAVGCGDGHVAMFGAGVTRPEVLLLVLGTSGVDLLMSDVGTPVPGFCGVCQDAFLPGYFGVEAGQSCIGDHFQWFAERCVVPEYQAGAAERGVPMINFLNDEAEKIRPGQTGLMALDWWNGNRSVLVDSNLSGTIVGMTLTTKPIEVYRALVEGVAFGQKKIINSFVQNGMKVAEILAVGGIAEKSSFIMQVLADVLNLPIRLSAAKNATAMGAAVMAAVAAGTERGGFATIREAAEAFNPGVKRTFVPDQKNAAVYEELFKEYEVLHDYFGRTNRAMKNMKRIKARALS